MTIHLQIGDLSKNSEWTRGHSDGKRTALISCPSCGKGVSLTKHNISEDGFVQPSLICPWNCGFHGFLVLDGWNAKDPKVKKKDIFTADTEILILCPLCDRPLYEKDSVTITDRAVSKKICSSCFVKIENKGI